MNARIHLHVREHPEGRVLVTPVIFPDLQRDGPDYATALGVIRPLVAERLANNPTSFRIDLANPPPVRLDRVRVTVARPAKKGGDITITMGIAIIEQPTSSGVVHVVRAPEASRFEMTLADPGDLEPVALALGKHMRKWGLRWIVTADEVGEVRLEVVEVPFADDPNEDGPPFEGLGDELTERAAQGRLGRLDRRDPIVERVLAALAGEGRCSVMLVGAPDVGKTALLHEVAARLASGDVPPALQGRRLWRTSANELIAGAQYTGQWQGRARQLIRHGRSDRSIIALGDPIGIIDAGKWSKSDNNLSRVLRPYVQSGELALVCETTPEGLAAARKQEPSFVDAFHRVDIAEPGDDDAREIVAAAARRLEANHGLAVDADALAATLELTKRFEPYRALPGKAVRLLEEVFQLAVTRGGVERLGREDVVTAFSARTGLPLAVLSDEVPMRVDEVRAFFEARVLGQPEAVAAMVDLVAVAKAGLNDPAKPLGSFFFVGPTGVGKTELTKALAEFLFGSRDRVLRFDMGEYGAGDALPRLIGTAWRSDGEGELTRRVREQPFCVVLLDEIEKAHRDVFDALLSPLGEGRLTDASGRTADFRNAIVIMTSNLGAGPRESRAVGFGAEDAAAETERLKRHFVEQAERFFRPEFFNRIDRVIAFHALDERTVLRIARRELGRLLMREGITRRQLLVEIDDAVVELLAARGFDPQYGARPLQREIERSVIQPLARLVVERRPRAGDLVRFHRAGDSVEVDLHSLERPRPPRAREPRPAPPPRGDATLARAAADAAALAELVEAEEHEPVVERLRTEVSTLVPETHDPAFWDEPDDARAVLARLYQLERALERLSGLRERAAGLAELGRQVRANRDRRRLPELRQALAEVEDGLELARLELAGAAAGAAAPVAVVRVAAVAAGADAWAEELLAMYAAWAERTGRESRRVDGGGSALEVRGLASYELLAHEAGLHRRVVSGEEAQLARVIVLTPDEEEPPGGDPAEIVRVYTLGRRSSVRDPRTSVRLADVDAVLQGGRIDAFLLARLRARVTA